MKTWQLLALISGSIITIVMALASISYSATLATPEPAFAWLPLPNTVVFGALALAFDLGMIASMFGSLYWWRANRLGALTCVALFVIASLFSLHAVRGYIALNVTKASAPSMRAVDLYASMKLELVQAQAYLSQLQASYKTATRRDRRRLHERIERARAAVHEARARLAQAQVPATVPPLAGHEWFLAIMLWFFNASCWGAWFGVTVPASYRQHDTVTAWLSSYTQAEPQHCALIFTAYADWCSARGLSPLSQYSFYARLIELGAKKFRDGRNGPTMYALPDHPS